MSATCQLIRESGGSWLGRLNTLRCVDLERSLRYRTVDDAQFTSDFKWYNCCSTTCHMTCLEGAPCYLPCQEGDMTIACVWGAFRSLAWRTSSIRAMALLQKPPSQQPASLMLPKHISGSLRMPARVSSLHSPQTLPPYFIAASMMPLIVSIFTPMKVSSVLSVGGNLLFWRPTPFSLGSRQVSQCLANLGAFT